MCSALPVLLKKGIKMSTQTAIQNRVLLDVKEPPRFRVIFLNDDVTTVEFVIESLIIIFHKTKDEARDITLEIQNQGSAVVAVLPYEIAEQKGIEVSVLAKRNGFPLVVKLEPEQ